jgi:hypothetical protein
MSQSLVVVLPTDALGVILHMACVDNCRIMDLFAVCKQFNLILNKLFVRQIRNTFECKVCHVGNKDLRCKCPAYTKTRRSTITGSGHRRHRWNNIDQMYQTHVLGCTLNKPIMSLDGVCIPCLRDAKPLECDICDIIFMSVYKGSAPKCPICLDRDTTKVIALPSDLPFG